MTLTAQEAGTAFNGMEAHAQNGTALDGHILRLPHLIHTALEDSDAKHGAMEHAVNGTALQMSSQAPRPTMTITATSGTAPLGIARQRRADYGTAHYGLREQRRKRLTIVPAQKHAHSGNPSLQALLRKFL